MAAGPRNAPMTEAKFPKFSTLSLHAGQKPDPVTGARAVPIYQTTSYVFRDSDHAASLFNLEEPGYIYTRIGNPTVAVLEERLAALEGGVGSVATASGQAALHLAIATLMSAGSHIVAAASLYGGSINLLKLTLPRFGINASFVDPRDPASFRRAIRPETRLVFAEVLGNPGLEVLDIPAVAKVAHDAGLPLLVDATFATPYLLRPVFLDEVDAVIAGIGFGQGRKFARFLPIEPAAVDADAADGDAMAADPFGDGMHHQIGAVFHRPQEIGRGEGGVDQQRQARVVCHLGYSRNVEHFEARIAQHLGEDQPRLGPNGAAEGRRVARIDEAGVNAEARQGELQQVDRAAVKRRRRDDVRSRAHQRGDGEMQRRLAAGRCHRSH